MFLSLVFHNHQPVGQLPWSFEDAWRDSYAPFLEVLEKHPQVKVALHYTGALLDWLIEHKPETIEKVRVLVARGQVEILGGGYYEPILTIWPHDDQIAQMQLLSARISEIFGRKPRGMWLAERVWEPQLVGAIRQAGLEYTFVDGTVFENAGVQSAQSFDVFQVAAASNEDATFEYSKATQNAVQDADLLAVFPINQSLRHIIPWHPGAESINYLKDVYQQKGDQAAVVFADDGEKFGAWPGTFQFIYEEGWLDTFFSLLETNSDWLQTATPSEILDARRHSTAQDSGAQDSSTGNALPRVDLPPGSYSEMQDWSGGNWRNFLKRYRESRDIYDEVLRVRELVAASDNANVGNENARNLILQAQCNDPLWHGVFGGLYLRHLRQALYARTIEAQVAIEGKDPFVRIKSEENGDIILENEQVKCGVRRVGGHLFNWTSKASRHNVLSTLRRYHEPYHAPDSPEDWYPRAALLDHFLGATTTPENFAQARYPEQGDFVSEAWTVETKSNKKAASVVLRRDGGVWVGENQQPISMQKTLTLRAGSSALEIEYSIRNNAGVKLDLWWANEWNVAMSGTDLPTRHYHAENHKKQLSLSKTAAFRNVSNPIVADSWLQLQAEWSFSQPLGMWHIPIWSVSQKEGGEIERTHQSSAFVFLKRLSLPRNSEYSISFTVALNSKREWVR